MLLLQLPPDLAHMKIWISPPNTFLKAALPRGLHQKQRGKGMPRRRLLHYAGAGLPAKWALWSQGSALMSVTPCPWRDESSHGVRIALSPLLHHNIATVTCRWLASTSQSAAPWRGGWQSRSCIICECLGSQLRALTRRERSTALPCALQQMRSVSFSPGMRSWGLRCLAEDAQPEARLQSRCTGLQPQLCQAGFAVQAKVIWVPVTCRACTEVVGGFFMTCTTSVLRAGSCLGCIFDKTGLSLRDPAEISPAEM